jgi:hypothetical protein
VTEEHPLIAVVRAAAARWGLSEDDANAVVQTIKPEAFTAYDANPGEYSVEAVSRAMASIVHFQIGLPRAVQVYLDATNQ